MVNPATAMYDALIIGAGPAGLSTALGLARQTYSAIVFDSQKYRNSYASRMHNVITWDHKDPFEFRAAARENIVSRYDTIRVEKATIESATKKEDGTFELVDSEKNKYHGKKLVIATGVTDIFPQDIKGFGDVWGKLVFHCLFCHGYEERGVASAGVMAAGMLQAPPMVLHTARMASRLAQKITIYTHGNEAYTAALQKEFEGKPLTIDARKIVSMEKTGENHLKMEFDDGEVVEHGFLVAVPDVKINGNFHEQLGLDIDPGAFIKVNPPFYETSVPGVFAVGDCATMVKAVPQAIAMGTFGAAGLVAQLGAMGKL
ncbi:hypothetical protein QBC35DRAFT_477191 [Podospora australis]|uniref:FAD/NAD(P)-binding domain-containing protein n=1 Tax=Podospora australis TaxID=1536484 RepID=A0AAN6WMC7_9PEZI|nr:hypothetical protein QBC35DRAFT_477191 [Podospora australis]